MSETTPAIRVETIGVVRITGKDRVDLLHRLSTNDLRNLVSGRTTSTVFTTPQGKMVDWVRLLAVDDALYACASPERAPALVLWLGRYTIMEDVQYLDESAGWRLVTVQGPRAAAVVGLAALPEVGAWARVEGELWLRGLAAYGERMNGLLPAARVEPFLARSRGAGARELDAATWERWRVMAGVPSPEHEFAEPVNPLELRLAQHAVAWNKGCYIGQEVIARLDTYDKLARVLMGLASDASIAGDGVLKIRRDGKSVGRVTSLVPGEAGGAVGLCVVNRDAAEPGDVEVETSAGVIQARLVDRPFWRPRST